MTDAPRVAFQGEPGAFSEEAALGFFGEAVAAHPVPTWRAVFEGVESATDDAGVVAIESSLAGSIRGVDLLSEFYDRGVRIVGEVSVPVRPRSSRCPASRSTGSSASTATPRPLPRPTRFSAAATGRS
jgi:prephenate dehydratase